MKRTSIIFALFLFLTLVFTFPLILRFNTSIPGFHSTDEPYGTLWNFWWLKYSYIHKINMYLPSVIASPFGLNLAQSPIYPVSDFINTFLTISFGEITAYNLLILISYLLSGFFMYCLVYCLTKSNMAAFFSGIIFSFSPYHAVRTWQHPSLAQVQWLPLYALSLYKLREKPAIRNILFCIISLSSVTLFNYYYTYFSLIIMVTFIAFICIFDQKNAFKISKPIFISTAITFLLLIPILLPIFNKAFFTPKTEDLIAAGYFREFSDLFEQSARPLSYFFPATTHPLFGRFTEKFIGSFLYGVSFTEHMLYLGWTPLVLAFIAFRRLRRTYKQFSVARYQVSGNAQDFYILFFLALAVVAWFFSQAPWWKFGAIKIYMPSFFMYKILPMFRAYCRFGIVVILAVAVLAGFGLKLILERFNSKRVKLAITCLFCSLVLFEFWNYPPFKVIDLSRVPAVYYWLKDEPGDFAITEYPLDIECPNEVYKFYQTRHGKKIINGTNSGTYANQIAQAIARLSDHNTAGILKWMQVKYVLVHKEEYLKTGLMEDMAELKRISANSGLKFVRSFSAEECPHKEVMCVQESGPVDVYEMVAQPIKP